MPGPYPIPVSPKIEGAGAAGDRHILMLDPIEACRLWELFAASRSASGWSAGSGAIFDLPFQRRSARRLDVRRRRGPSDLSRASPGTRRSPPG